MLGADCAPIDDPAALAGVLLPGAGLGQVGLFCEMVSQLVVGSAAGVGHRTRPGET